MNESNQINEKFLDEIIRVAYGEGNILERLRVYFRARKNYEIKKLLEEYRETAAALEEIHN